MRPSPHSDQGVWGAQLPRIAGGLGGAAPQVNDYSAGWGKMKAPLGPTAVRAEKQIPRAKRALPEAGHGCVRTEEQTYGHMDGQIGWTERTDQWMDGEDRYTNKFLCRIMSEIENY